MSQRTSGSTSDQSTDTLASPLLHDRPWRAMLRFLVPLWLGNVLQQSYLAIDTLILGHFTGVDGVASVGAIFGVYSILFGGVFAFTAGLTIRVGQAFGRGDWISLQTAFSSGLLLSVLLAALVGAVLTCLAQPTLTAIGVPESIRAGSMSFYLVYTLGLPITALSNYLTHIIRSLGNSRYPTIVMFFGGAANALFALFFIAVAHWGVLGAALAMMSAGIFVVVANGAWIWQHAPVRIFSRYRRLEMQPQLGQAAATGLQAASIGLGNVFLQVAINAVGPAAIAGVSVGLRIEGFALAPLAAFAICMVTYSAQHYGADELHRLLVGVREAVALALALGAVIAAAVLASARPLAIVFLGSDSGAAVETVVNYLAVSAGFYPVVATVYVLRGALQGVSQVRPAMWSGIAELCAKTSCAVAALASFGLLAIAVSGPVSWLLALVPLAWSWIAWKGRAAVRIAQRSPTSPPSEGRRRGTRP